ncbi:hypothetical protein HPB51_022374 [Rhipicephalus microplus]|uniref:Peptidase S1 domain-containing protein n=1 Tax=Rhipicephalus microplus TaxID=6941 RepID=A0A9J6DPY2_RHIMP|nr:hypothetical protein HPB51_022374 [Rhipicephalus microplus]
MVPMLKYTTESPKDQSTTRNSKVHSPPTHSGDNRNPPLEHKRKSTCCQKCKSVCSASSSLCFGCWMSREAPLRSTPVGPAVFGLQDTLEWLGAKWHTTENSPGWYQKSNFVVRVAEYNLRTKEPRTPAMTYTIDQLILHPDYRKVKKYDNDIALVRLSRKISYNEYAQPACLPSLTLSDTNGINVTVVGWGQVSEDVPRTPAVPLKAVLTVFDNHICNTWLHNHSMRVLDNHMCAGVEEGGKDACHGDSGGPLLALNNRRYVVVGVVAAGDGCALPRTPGIYTRVTAFLPWIMDYISPDSGDHDSIARNLM